MRFFDHLDKIDINEKTIVTIGSFDGIHLGHEKIFSDLKKIGKRENLKTVVITFFPHPAEILANRFVGLITLPEEKMEIIKSHNIDYLIIFPFSETIANIHYDDFVRDILIDKVCMNYMLVGYDHTLGKNREGTFNNLQSLAKTLTFGLSKVEPLELNEFIISSTLIRERITKGKVDKVPELLGRFYSVEGIVVHGDQRGRTIGFPTANILIDCIRKALPKSGVYAVDVEIDGKTFLGMCNVGKNPTFGALKQIRVEVHILDFNRNLYEKKIKVNFLKYIREEKKFGNKEELQAQLEIDAEFIRKIKIT
jgi:riboflavin kinase/FMN adenylyltransferase